MTLRGDGEDAAALRAQATRLELGNVRFEGRLSPGESAAAFRTLLDDPARRRLADAGLRRAATDTWLAVASAVDELYDRVRVGRG